MIVLARYLRREVTVATLFVQSALLGLFAVFELIGELDELGEAQYGLAQIFAFVALSLPGHFYQIAPVGALIGTVVALAQLAQHSEYAVMRVSGVSNARLLGVLVRLGLVFAAAVFLVGEFVVPPSEQAAQAMRLQAKAGVVAQEFRSGLWVKDEGSFINVRQVTHDARLLGVRIFRFDERYRLRAISVAAEGRYAGDNRWLLRTVSETRFEPAGVQVAQHGELEWSTVLTPSILTVLLVDPDRMSVATLLEYVEHLRDNRLQAHRYEIALWRKLLYPLAIVVMMAMALPFAMFNRRSSSVGAQVFAGIMLGLSFHFLNVLFAHLGALYGWWPFLAAVLPSLAFLALAAGLLRWRAQL
jgi:lipopolysaccharide export system permease protein